MSTLNQRVRLDGVQKPGQLSRQVALRLGSGSVPRSAFGSFRSSPAQRAKPTSFRQIPMRGPVSTQATTFTAPSEASDIPTKPATVKWECKITSSAPLLGDTGTRLEIKVIDIYGDVESAENSVDGWLPPRLAERKDNAQGWTRSGSISLPAGLRAPGAILIRKLSDVPEGSVDYISCITLVSSEAAFYIPVDSWIASQQGWRVFFAGKAYLPKDTPPSLVDERNRDLQQLQGTPVTRTQERTGAERIYWYQTYNDLGNAKQYRPPLGGSKEFPYPRRLATNRGDQPDGAENPPPKGQLPWIPYDEQFSFYKAKGFTGDTLSGALNAAFSVIGESADQPNLTFANLLPTVAKGLLKVLFGVLPFAPKPLRDFEDFNDVLAMFKLDADQTSSGFKGIQPTGLYPKDAPRGMAAATSPAEEKPYKTASGAWDFRLAKDVADRVNEKTAKQRVGPVYDSATGNSSAGFIGNKGQAKQDSPPSPGAAAVAARLGTDVWEKVKNSGGDVNDLLYFTVPRVLEGRPDAWYTDEEYGRQMLAGYNPVVITALKELPEQMGSAIRGEHVNSELQGSTLDALVAEAAAGGKPRLYWVDYWVLSAFWEEEAAAEADESRRERKKAEQKVQHQARALFYLQKNDQGLDSALVPIAFELAGPTTHKENPGLPASAGLVYARSELAYDTQKQALWRLAKMVFKSCDFAVHEVFSHFTRAHAVMEPFLIGLRRNISTMHPVYKLMIPHFRYTVNINRNARTSLIQAGGIIESCFSSGQYSMRLGSKLYGSAWTFAGQALPVDLKARGMLAPDGKPWLDYPFAADGLDIWSAYLAYFDSYLRLYYGGDQDVVEDTELQAWWDDVKNNGHPDLVAFGLKTESEVWGFSGPIPSIPALVHVLATIAWVGSGHHAAVNFGQYDYTSFLLNTSALIRRQIPAPNPQDKAYKELVDAPLGDPQEKIIMEYLSDPFSAVKVMATVQLLSGHADDEQTLDEPNTYLADPAAVAANASFMAAMAALDAVIATRNADPANWARYHLADGPSVPLPYTLLQPPSGAGITFKGVPYSVSI